MKYSQYFLHTRQRADRALIDNEWILRVIFSPIRKGVQEDCRIRRWGKIAEMNGRVLRVILLPDGQTVHNAFFDRGFKE